MNVAKNKKLMLCLLISVLVLFSSICATLPQWFGTAYAEENISIFTFTPTSATE